ncbi:hypothetical protein B0H11DRAFT_2017561 [Mycena galericulata]|nr:hypothetical protein B0H11DRAFT_2017561 [Mycena galericulata]
MSESVEELEARIAKISAEIELQKTVLKSLEHSKIVVQRQLNSIRDPVARLPLEISSEIFIQCLPPLPEPGAHDFPMLFLNVSNAWSEIALSTPALWATIRIVSPHGEGFRGLVGIWLERARDCSLSISLSTDFSEDFASVIRRYGQQLKHLEVCYEDEGENSDENIDILRFANPVPLPFLQTLTVYCSSDLEYPAYRVSQMLQLLNLAPNLVECIFDCMRLVDDADDIQAPLVLPNLRRLMFGNAVNPDSDDAILAHLTLPRLESLSISMYEISGDDFSSFFERSSPPLRELVLGNGCDNVDITQLLECLRLVPILTRLTVWWSKSRTLEHIFAALAEAPSHLLPNLRSLTLTLYSTIPTSGSCWETLLRALTARRSKMQAVHIELDSSFRPAASTLGVFEELVADGMSIYIGTRNENFCSG